MKCPECNNRLRCLVDVRLSVSAEFERRLTKDVIRLQSTKIEAANWEGAQKYCPICYWSDRKVKE